MDDSISAASSADTSSCDDGTTTSSSISITELSHQFDRHGLHSSRRHVTYEPSPSRASRYHPSLQSDRNPTFFNTSHAVLQQRQCIIPRDSNSTPLSKIHNLVGGMLSDDEHRSISSFSASANTTAPLEPPPEDTLSPLQPSYRRAALSPSASSCTENEESDAPFPFRTQYTPHRVSKECRHAVPPKQVGKRDFVLKSIRIRRRFLKKRSSDKGKWRDR